MKNIRKYLSLLKEYIYYPFRLIKVIDEELTIRVKIIVLTGFIITALVIFISTTFAISNNEKKAFDSINLLNSIIQNLYNLVSVEDSYISTDDESYISRYVNIKDELEIGFRKLTSYSSSENIEDVKTLIEINKKHGEIFSNIIVHKNNIRNYKGNLENEIGNMRKIINSYLGENIRKEDRISFEKPLKKPVIELFRAENYKLLLQWFERLTFHQTIGVYSDFNHIGDIRKASLNVIDNVQSNIRRLTFENPDFKKFRTVFRDLEAFRSEALMAEEELIGEYIKTKITLKNLSKSSDKIKSISSVMYSKEYINIKDQLEVRNYLIIGIMFLALFTVLILSLLLFRSIMGSIFKTIEIVKAVSTGDLDIELKLNQKGELNELSESVNRMIENLRLKAQFAEKVSNGILNRKLETGGDKDLLGSALLEMAESLSLIISNIRNTSDNLLGNSEKITDISRFLKEGSETQLKSLQNIASNVEEIRDMASSNYEDARNVNELALSTRDQSERGYKDVKEMLKSIIEINSSSKDIVKINKVIDDIAFKTQLLSINASIEAARAGKHGKGFSVVASEIRDLAEKSSDAAFETENLIKGTLNIIGRGKKTAEDAGLSFEEIVKGISKVSELIDSIVKSSFEQQKGIGDINDGIRLIEQVSVKNAGNSVDADKATDELLKQVDELKGMLSKFRI